MSIIISTTTCTRPSPGIGSPPCTASCPSTTRHLLRTPTSHKDISAAASFENSLGRHDGGVPRRRPKAAPAEGGPADGLQCPCQPPTIAARTTSEMYLTHFGLRERPFSNTPDLQFVYLGPRHEEALAHLLYGVQEHGGFVQLTGEIGTGKTTVCRLLLERLPEGVDVALILNPILSPEELLAALCDELGVKYEAGTRSRKVLVDLLYRHLLAAHAGKRRTVLIVDEAQNLTVEALEQLRLLTNLETAKQKLLQIMLIGQPELVELLDRPELRQLSQRITAR